MEMTPEWVKVLPVQLRGGPQSESRLRAETMPRRDVDMEVRVMAPLSMEKEAGTCPHAKTCPNAKECGGKVYEGGGAVHSAKWDRCVKKVRAKGKVASPEAICTKSVGKKVGGAVGAYEKKAGGYTGHEADGTIVADKPVNEKTFVDHQGEFYSNAPLTQILGGPDAVEKMLIQRAQEVINGKKTPNPALPAITDTKSAGLAKSPGSANKPGMAFGGLTDSLKKLGSKISSGVSDVVQPVAQKVTDWASNVGGAAPAPVANQEPMQSFGQDLPKPVTSAPAPVEGATRSIDVNDEQTGALTKVPQVFRNGAWYAANQIDQGPAAPIPQPPPAVSAAPAPLTANSAETDAAKARARASNAAPATKLRPDQTQATSLLVSRLGRQPTAEEAAFIQRADKTQLAEYLGKLGIMTPEQVKKIKDEAVLAGTTSATPPKTAYDEQVKLALKKLNDLASGNDPVMKQIIDTTMQQFGSDTAAGIEALRMQLGNQGITGPAAQAILNSYARNARINSGQLTSNFALQVAKDAQAASQQLLTTGLEQQAVERGYTTAEQARLQAAKDAEQTYDTTQRENAMTKALAGSDYVTYARLYEQQYGVKLNTDALKDAATATKVKNATADIMAALGTNGAAGFDDPALGGILKKSVQAIWEANGNTGPVPEDQANRILEEYRTNTSPAGQLRNALSEQDVVDMFFAGDMDALNDFQIGNYKPGYESFQHALPSMFTIGGIKKNADGTLDFNWDKILKSFPELTIHKAVKVETPPSGTFDIGSDFTTDKGVTYKVEAVNQDGSMDLDLNGVKYTAKKGAAEGDWNIAASEEQAGYVEVIGKQPTIDGVGITYNGQKIYFLGNGKYNTKADGTGMNLKVDNTATNPTAAAKLSGWNSNAAGNLISSSGAELLTADGQEHIRPAPGDTSGKWGVSDNGHYYQLGADGATATPVSKMDPADFLKNMNTLPTAVVDSYFKDTANTPNAAGDTAFDIYIAGLGTAEPSSFMVQKWIASNDTAATSWAADKVYSNPAANKVYAITPQVKAELVKRSVANTSGGITPQVKYTAGKSLGSTWETTLTNVVSVPASAWPLTDDVTAGHPPVVGKVITINGRPAKIMTRSSEFYEPAVGDNHRYFSLSFQYLDDGTMEKGFTDVNEG